jgi:hypothetical protein
MSTCLQQTMPVYHFHECHTRWIDASPTRVWHALNTLTVDQLTVTKPLVAVRRLGTQGNEPARPFFGEDAIPIFEATAPGYIVGGVVGRPWQFRPERQHVVSLRDFEEFNEPGWTKYVADFHLEPRGRGVQLTTETRGYSTSDGARRRFAAYWAVIRPFSGLIRRDMLATIARTA